MEKIILPKNYITSFSDEEWVDYIYNPIKSPGLSFYEVYKTSFKKIVSDSKKGLELKNFDICNDVI